MKNPMVSVVVTTYNREEYLKETIHSILNQTYTDYELIVVDNYSNYDFFKVIEEFDDERIRPFQNQNNGIIAVNRNYGIKQARGQYLAFCDDDDLWMPEKLEKQLEIVNDFPQTIIATNLIIIDNIGNCVNERCFEPYKSKLELYIHNKLSLSSVLVVNSGEIRFDEKENLIGIEDYSMWLKLIHRGFNVHILQCKLVKYREGNQNYSKRDRNLPLRRVWLLCHIYKNERNSSIYYLFRSLIYNIRVYIQYYLFR